eukprot:TRINITY_DN4364_c0_g4_i1.p1 TRINITY_DN4364_c0_g4~~TRINITY_DN4364_c0_g4_i1.p1  ORF type:complete len:426 (-),score=64.75 TRINITY_DN4364_c0_g4_i1:240-1517(-)
MAPSSATLGIEILEDRLYWLKTSAPPPPADGNDGHYFSIDGKFKYEPFAFDFGPVDLGMTYRYITLLEKKLTDPLLAGKPIIHYCSEKADKCANAAYLICAYLVTVRRMTAEAAFRHFEDEGVSFKPFRDVSRAAPTFTLSILDCLRGLEAGIRLGWFNWKTFDINDYEHYYEVENGDMNWIVPDKVLACAGPFKTGVDGEGYKATTPSELVPVFKAKSVELVVRLNSPQYDQLDFINRGINHVDLIFQDGSCPNQDIIRKFLFVLEKTQGAVAVHCKAGLGRTGTLIGLYAMKHYGITAMEFIAWSRLCRPGSVIGPQQQFLCDMQEEMFRLGTLQPRTVVPGVPEGHADPDEDILVQQTHKMLRIDAARQFTEIGQGERLVRAKKKTESGREPSSFRRTLCSIGLPATKTLSIRNKLLFLSKR